MRFLKPILLCWLLITVGCTEREEISDLQVRFKNTTDFEIENLKISDKTIGTLNSYQSTQYIDFEKFGFDSGLPDESCIGLINNEAIESFNKLYWRGTQKNTVYKGFYEMIITLKEVNGTNYLMLKNQN
jgi:hypothetical protein